MTEDDLVAAIRAALANPARERGAIVIGIGDDAAAWRPSRSNLSVITTDALVDGVHFLRAAMSPQAIGARAMASNLSDIAAMGARPRLATIALGVPPDVDERWILAAYAGLSEVANRFGAAIVGGDIVRAPSIMLSITVVGEVSPSKMKRRDGGRPGDVLAVTGALGASRAGLELVRNPRELGEAMDESCRDAALAAFLRPEPRVREGAWFGASRSVHAMMDLSDGLSTDAARMALASGCGATLADPPVHVAAFAVANAYGDDPTAYALDGGEDFALLVAVAPRAFAHLQSRFALRFGTSLLAVGTLDREPGLRGSGDAGERPLALAGYDHLRDS